MNHAHLRLAKAIKNSILTENARERFYFQKIEHEQDTTHRLSEQLQELLSQACHHAYVKACEHLEKTMALFDINEEVEKKLLDKINSFQPHYQKAFEKRVLKLISSQNQCPKMNEKMLHTGVMKLLSLKQSERILQDVLLASYDAALRNYGLLIDFYGSNSESNVQSPSIEYFLHQINPKNISSIVSDIISSLDFPLEASWVGGRNIHFHLFLALSDLYRQMRQMIEKTSFH